MAHQSIHRSEIVDELRRLLAQQSVTAEARPLPFGLPAIDAHLPQGGLAGGALHEVVPAAGETGRLLFLLRPPGMASVAVTRWRVAAERATRDRFGLIARWRWQLKLERCRNGRPGQWIVEFDHATHHFSLAAALADPTLSRSTVAHAYAHVRAG